MKLLKFIVYILLTAAVAFAVIIIGVYSFGLQEKASHSFANFLPLPEALVGTTLILGNEVSARLAGFEQISPEIEVERKFVRDSLIREAIVERELKKRNLQVTRQELDTYYVYLQKSLELGGSSQIREKLGWSESEFKRHMVLPELEFAKLAVAVMAEHKSSDEYAKIVAALDDLREGKDFAEVVQSHSEDARSMRIAGDIGYKDLDGFNPWIAAVAKNLQVSETSGIVISPEGYEILKVVSRDDSTALPKLQIRHILVRGLNLSQYLESVKNNYRIFVFNK